MTMPDPDSVERIRPALFRVVVAHDGDEHLLGRPDLGIYVAVPEPGAILINALRDGASLAEATAKASAAAGADVDGADFLAGLADAGLLTEAESTGGPGIRWIEWVSPRAARRLFGRVAWVGYGLAVLVALGVLVLRPDLRPNFDDVWFLGDPVLSLLASIPIWTVLTGAHEMWHWLAGRAVGVPAVFRISRRGVFLVMETDLTQIVTVPRRKRYGPFLAGMAFDCVVLAVALILRWLYRADLLDLPPVVDRALGVVVINQVISVVWQWAAVYLRSDGYAVLANALRCHNLNRATWLTAKDRLWRLTPAEADELLDISAHDRAVARWFAIVYVVGLFGVAWVTANFGLPFLIIMGQWLINNLASASMGSVTFWESVGVTVLLLIQWAGPPLLGWRERRMRKAGELL
jgi:putative peptide zinc metalloprotease protein